jgi:hypothetical protein
MKLTIRLPIIVCAVAVLFAVSASAAVIGQLQVDSGGGQVVVTATTIDWQPPVGAPDGPIEVGGTIATLFYGPGSATPLAPGTPGRIKDLPGGADDFMTFPTALLGGPVFDLAGFGAGSSTSCFAPGAADSPGESCSIPGSAFVLTYNEPAPGQVSTSITLGAFGTATDSTGELSNWFGTFTTQITGRTPLVIATNIAGGGSETSTHSGEFTAAVAAIPEPGTWTMLLLGGGLMAVAARRRSARR